MKTIKQIADELGVSKQTVRDRIAKLGLQSTLQKNGNTLVVDEQQETLIKKDFNDETQSESQSTLQSESQSDVRLALRLLEQQNELLSKELNIKNKQIDEILKSNHELTAALQQTTSSLQAAHALHAGTIQNQKQLTGFALDYTEEQPTAAEEPDKPGFIERLRQLFK